MKIDYLVRKEGELSTYEEEKLALVRDPRHQKGFFRIERRIEEAEDYQNLIKMCKVKLLDSKTGLHEIILDRLRVLHFLYQDQTTVLLGTFLKKTQKTPQSEVDKNNRRINEYLKLKHEKQD